MKIREILHLLVVVTLVLFVAPSCVKEGPPGLDGQDGIDGVDGQDGRNGNVTCLACHNKESMNTIRAQYETSVHGVSPHTPDPTYIYAGRGESRKSCAICHTHEGFVEVVFTGRDSITSALLAPTRIGCETCHGGHISFDFETDGQDYALRTTAPVKMMMYNDPTKVLDFQSSSNLCVKCHQSRAVAPLVPDDSGNYKITSSRFGPHHGPQGNFLEGLGGYELVGSVPYPGTKSAAHRKDTKACVTCHMHEGNHTFNPNKSSCTQCHGEINNFDVNGLQTEVEELLVELRGLLVEKNILNPSTGLFYTGTYPVELAGVAYNYKAIEEDRSKGVHNPGYILALLKNSIQALQ